MGCSTDHRSVHLDVSFSYNFRSISVPFYVFWIHKPSRLKKLMQDEIKHQEIPEHLGTFGSHYNSLMGSISR
jgi:hypothetical protein